MSIKNVTVQPQSSSKGEKSVKKLPPLILKNPFLVNAVPNRAVRVLKTQSNISTPRQEHTTKSTGYPTPIRYRGLSLGKISVQRLTILQKSAFISSPAKPPIAYLY